MTQEQTQQDNLQLATELTVAWLSNPNTRAGAEDVPAFLGRVQAALEGLSSGAQAGVQPLADEAEHIPAVTARKSLANPNHIISMIDGKPYKTLRRHLARHGLTPEQYRERYGLKADYPMVSPSYSEVRRDMAKKIGLGRKAGSGVEPAGGDQVVEQPSEAAEAAKPARAPRRRKAEAEPA